MDALAKMAEKKILEAMRKGEFDHLPGAGKPLLLDDDSMVPEELRVAYRLLKNAGCLPPELELHKEIVTLKSLLCAARTDGERKEKFREMNFKLLKLNLHRKRPLNLEDFPVYGERITEKLAG